jgi:glycosyltransferase involved in cell wall biosynthesis
MNTHPSVTIVVPVFNEEDGIDVFIKTLIDELNKLDCISDVLFVNDGSKDGTALKLDAIQASNPARIGVVHFSRNFGHQAAITAGMDMATGDAVITMDADLQHPPSLIPKLLECWQEGADVVQTIRTDSNEISWFKKITSKAFYEIINYFSLTRIEPGAADFRLLSRKVVDIFKNELRERDRFLRGLIAWAGFRTIFVSFEAPARFAGTTKYSLSKMLNLARSGLVSFSRVPLKLSVICGLIFSVISILYGLFSIYAYFFMPSKINPGWASIVVGITFMGGCQLVFLGLIGEYLSTVFDEVKARPIYIVSKKQLIK